MFEHFFWKSSKLQFRYFVTIFEIGEVQFLEKYTIFSIQLFSKACATIIHIL